MMRCDPRAYARYPDHQICGSVLGDAVFVEGSECDEFNRQVLSQPMTNADRIRAMSDEELAEFIGHHSLCDRIQGESTWCEEHAVCENCLTEWLQQPVKEVQNGSLE